MPEPYTQQEQAPPPAKRLSLSHVVEMLLQKSPRDHSSVTLARNARGVTQIEVVVRTGEDATCSTPDDAMGKAIELYDRARLLYPMPDETNGGPSS